jgi:hypothetical protein
VPLTGVDASDPAWSIGARMRTTYGVRGLSSRRTASQPLRDADQRGELQVLMWDLDEADLPSS